MGLMQEIDAAQKDFASAIKDAEEMKKDVLKFEADAAKASKEFSADIKRVITELANAQANLENWETGFDLWIGALKEANRDFVQHKKRSVEVEKFYKDLEEEKDERDKARKKLGAGSKPSKEDEIADAAFKRAKSAYDNDPGRSVELMLKTVAESTKGYEADYKMLVSDFKHAMADYEKMAQLINSFKLVVEFKSSVVGNWKTTYSAIGPEFEKYYKTFK